MWNFSYWELQQTGLLTVCGICLPGVVLLAPLLASVADQRWRPLESHIRRARAKDMVWGYRPTEMVPEQSTLNSNRTTWWIIWSHQVNWCLVKTVTALSTVSISLTPHSPAFRCLASGSDNVLCGYSTFSMTSFCMCDAGVYAGQLLGCLCAWWHWVVLWFPAFRITHDCICQAGFGIAHLKVSSLNTYHVPGSILMEIMGVMYSGGWGEEGGLLKPWGGIGILFWMLQDTLGNTRLV